MSEDAPIAERRSSVQSLLNGRVWPWILLGVLLLLPFIGKPLHIDDPPFLWQAQHVSAHPLDPSGFDLNWYGTLQPMHAVTGNPPLVSYFIALVAAVVGWSEVALHLAFMIPAALVILGTWSLARRWTRSPALATAGLLASPTFLVSASTLMCDVLMLAFWIWALVLWVKGTDEDDPRRLVLGALCATGAILTKYPGASVLGLMALYSMLTTGPRLRWMLPIALPLALWFAYEAWCRALYGHTLLLQATSMAKGDRWPSAGDLLVRGLATLTFLGGSAAYVLVSSVSLLKKRQLLTVLAMGAVAFGLLLAVAVDDWHGLRFGSDVKLLVFLQAGLWISCAVTILVLVAHEAKSVRAWRTARDPVAIVLAAWILGVVAFTWLLNWSVNGRTLLPLLPAVAILVARKVERAGAPTTAVRIGIVSGLLVGALVMAADAELARTQRTAAETLVKQSSTPGSTTWFQGHWGFQHYAQAAGGTAHDWTKSEPRSGDRVIVPLRNANVFGVPKERAASWTRTDFALQSIFATMDSNASAGFYAHQFGLLPFAVSTGEPDMYWVIVIR